MWEKVCGCIRKAAAFILFGSVILWVPNTFPLRYGGKGNTCVAHAGCYSAKVGRFFEPVSRYAGMDWQANSSMIGAFFAMELLVTQLCILFRVEPDEKVMWDMDARQRSEYEE